MTIPTLPTPPARSQDQDTFDTNIAAWISSLGAWTTAVNAMGITTITGSIQSTPIGNVTPSTGAFTTVSASGLISANGGIAAPTSVLGNVYSGTYTPTITAVTNVAATGVNVTQYSRVGNLVTVAGQCTIDPTSTGLVQFRMSLPVASNLASVFQLGGSGGTEEATIVALYIIADATNKEALCGFNATSAANQGVSFTFSYLVI